MILNNYHAMFITGPTILEYLKLKKLGYSGNSVRSQALVEYINKIEDKIDNKDINREVFKWMYQGQRKVIFTNLEEYQTDKYKVLTNISQLNMNNIDIHKNLNGILNLGVSENNYDLLDIVFRIKNDSEEYSYIFKSNTENYPIEGNLEEIVFIYSKTVSYIKNPKEEFSLNNIKIPIPVFISIDIINNEIQARVPAKSDIYTIPERDSIEDINIAKLFLNKTIEILDLTIENNLEYKEKIAQCIFDIHREITELPQEIIDKSVCVNTEIDNFVEDIIPKLDLELEEEEIEQYQTRESLVEGIKNLILKEILKTYGEEDIPLFEENKFATSIGLKSRGASYASLNYNSKDRVPVQCNPEYKNIESILNEIKKLNKNTILWKSNVKKGNSKIRTKLYIDTDGYGIISFEEYTLEEDINNVLSKIREFKERQ